MSATSQPHLCHLSHMSATCKLYISATCHPLYFVFEVGLGLYRLGSVRGGGPGLVGHAPGHGAGRGGYHLHLHAELEGWGAWQSKAITDISQTHVTCQPQQVTLA